MKKTAVFLSGCFLSHIIPIKPLVKALQRNGYSILILNTIEHKELIESYDAQFIEYPCEIDKIKYDDILSCYLSRLKQAQQEENVQLYYELITKIGSIRVNNFENKTADLLMKKIRGIQPTIIFSDAINIYGDYISKKLNIECVGYITNNIYNEKFLTTKNGYLWKTFSRNWGVSHLYPESFFIEYWDYLNQVYREVATENSIPYVPPMVHFEPKGQKKIVFTSKFLQPKRAIANEKNYFFIPKNFERDKPASVSKRLKCFLDTRNKIVYIAHGSYLDVNLNYYIPLIQLLVKKDIKIVISTGKNKKDFLNKLSSIPTKKKLIYCDEFLNQKYVLSKADLFITHGGMNSIMEAISNEVPMLLNPITPEQRINSLIVNNKKIGISNYKRDKWKTTGEAIEDLLNNSMYKSNIHKLNLKIKNEIKRFDSNKLLDFIER